MQQVFKNFLEPNAAGNEITPDMVRNEMQVNMGQTCGIESTVEKGATMFRKKKRFFLEKKMNRYGRRIKKIFRKKGNIKIPKDGREKRQRL